MMRSGTDLGQAPALPGDDDARWMHRCLELAAAAHGAGETPVGALVVQSGHVVGEGYEATRAELDPSAHAEVMALRAACRTLGRLDLGGATLYTTVEPCVLCSYAIRQARVARVVYGVPAGRLGGVTGEYHVLTQEWVSAAAAPVVQGGVLASECAELLGRPRHAR